MMKRQGSSIGAVRGGAKGRTMAVDPTLPQWICQNCHHALCGVGVESYSGMQGSTVEVISMGASPMDDSFLVLSKQSRIPGPGMPARPTWLTPQPDVPQSSKAMEESYVLLPPPISSAYIPELGSDGGATQLHANSASCNSPSQGNINNTNILGFHSSVEVLKRASEITTSQTQIDQPLCLECMRVVLHKLENNVKDVIMDIQAYEACLQSLQAKQETIHSEADFLKENEKIEEEERELQAAIQEAEKQCSEVNAEMKDLERKTKLFDELEARYWHDFNNFQFQLTSCQEEKDAILAKIEVSQAHLELLRQTNVLNDAFFISHEGEFGTINNFRLGCLPKIQVDWDEVNAAWGQSCLLLHTMAEYFRPKFPYRIKIIPMGSYPRITDTGGNTYELFGPVNTQSTQYNKAMTLFLKCLKEFAEFASIRDQENNILPEKCFRLPYKILKDKVGSYTIIHSFNNLEGWTKALKYMLCNLKWILYWFMENTNFQPFSSMASSHSDVLTPANSSLYKKAST